MTLPNFFIIGAPRCGTSSLWRYLGQHPDVFVSRVKEPRHFSADDPLVRHPATAVRDRSRYEALFRDVRHERAVGEATSTYLCCPAAIEPIRQAVPDARLIVSLRHPADRAYASFLGHRREGTEPCSSFAEALRQEERRLRDPRLPLPAIASGLYGRQLQQWFAAFPREQFSVHLFEDFVADPAKIVRRLFEFIGVDPDFEPDVSVRHNASVVIPSPLVRAAWARGGGLRRRSRKLLPLALREAVGRVVMRKATKPPIPADLRDHLVEAFREDILLLQDLLGRDLSHWLEPS